MKGSVHTVTIEPLSGLVARQEACRRSDPDGGAPRARITLKTTSNPAARPVFSLYAAPVDARDPLGDCQSVLRLRAVARRRAPSSRLQRVAALMVSGVICYLLSVIRALIAVEAFTFFVGAALHLGVPVVGLDEPRIFDTPISVAGFWQPFRVIRRWHNCTYRGGQPNRPAC
jgi:hypothetical protein